jgi:hypothetical protein
MGDPIDQRTCDIKTEACQRTMCNKFSALEKIMTIRFDALDEAVRLRALDVDRKMISLNELRGEVLQDREQFVRKESYEFAHRALETLAGSIDTKVNLVINRLTAVETRAVTWTASVALFFMILQVVLHFWGPK